MLKLLKKDFVLAMHPMTPFFLLLSAMVLIPNYPYSVVFFYTELSFFFTCLSGRENKDVNFSLSLPVAKSDIVRARIAFTVCLQMIQLTLAGVLGILSQHIYAENPAGLEANLAFVGWGLILYGISNLIFFGVYYRNVERVGTALLCSSATLFGCILIEIAATYAIPFVRDVLDTKDPEFLLQKLIFLSAGLCFYIISLLLTAHSAVKNFEKQDF